MIELSVRHAFKGFDLEVEFTAPGGVTAILGRSGAGKTTLVRAMAGLMRVQHSRIVVGGEVLCDSAAGLRVPPHRRRVGYVFQDSRLFPHLTVQANLLYGAPRGTQLAAVVDLLGIGALLSRRPAGLSGGERQRVAIGRALLSAPRLLLMDEPLASLDAQRRGEILPYLERLRDEAGLPIIYVSHAVDEIARLANTVVALDNGRVQKVGPTSEVLSDTALAAGIGPRQAGAILSGRLQCHHDDGLSEVLTEAGPLLLPRIAAPLGSSVRVRIAAQDIILSQARPQGVSALNIFPAVVTEKRQGEGPGVMLRLRVGQAHLLCRLTRRSSESLGVAVGMPCWAMIKAVATRPDRVWRG